MNTPVFQLAEQSPVHFAAHRYADALQALPYHARNRQSRLMVQELHYELAEGHAEAEIDERIYNALGEVIEVQRSEAGFFRQLLLPKRR
jgi:hypothetical protein